MEQPKLRDGKIVRSEEPLNLEMPFENLDGFITPTKSFYVRTHFPSRRSTGTNGGYGLKAKSKRRLKQITAS